MKAEINEILKKTAQNRQYSPDNIKVDYPENPEFGDLSTNIAMVNAKNAGKAPLSLAQEIVDELQTTKPDFIETVTIAKPGFINFKVKDEYFFKKVLEISKKKEVVEKSSSPKKVMVEFTDPNPFKIFHIGHLMSNAIGESISRLIQSDGTKVIRACYQGDVGLHVAKTLWAITQNDNVAKFREAEKMTDVVKKVAFLGEMYVYGAKYDDDADKQKEIAAINKKIFEKCDTSLNEYYEKGRKWSLDYFDMVYQRLGTQFDQFYFESEVHEKGIQIVKQFMGTVFVESEGAVIFKGEDHGLHTRVFITSNGLPAYETKELGLNTKKFEQYPELDESVIITANEQSDYFRVLIKVLSLTYPEIAKKTKHFSHGMLRFASGKMSSRKGNVIAGEDLINDIKALVAEKIKDREFTEAEKNELSDMIAVAAIKYSILRQSVGSDVIFDSANSISFEGDSGPYLQYSAVRARSILEKAKKEGITADGNTSIYPKKASIVDKFICRFPDVVERARNEYAPQLVSNYLVQLAGAFNSFYANQIIIDPKDPVSPYYVSMTKSFEIVITKGLEILGIKVPNKM